MMVSSLARLVVLSAAAACTSTGSLPGATAQLASPAIDESVVALSDDVTFVPPPSSSVESVRTAISETERKLLQIERLATGADHLSAGDPASALESLDPLIAEDDTSSTAFFLRGLARMQLGRAHGALADLERATVLTPDDPGPYGLIARLRAERGELPEAIAALRTSIDLGYAEAWSHATLGHLLLEHGDFIAAHEALMTAVELDGDCIPAHRGLATLFSTVGDAERSTLAYRAVLRTEPDEIAALIGLGHALRDLDRGTEALTPYMRARDLQPERAAHAANIAATYYEVGRYEESVEEYERTLSLSDQTGVDEAVVHVSIASLHEKLGRLEDAIDEYEWALEIDPAMGLAHEALGMIAFRAGRTHKARRSLTAAFELGALRPASIVALAEMREARDDVAGVEELVSILTAMAPESSDAAYALADIRVHSDIAQVHDAAVGEALLTPHLGEDFARNGGAWKLMSEALAAQGRFAEAADAMEHAMTLVGTTGVRYREYVARRDSYRAENVAQR